MRSVVIKAGRPSGTRGVRLRRRLRLRPFGRFRLSGTGAASPPVSQQPAAASPAGETEPTPTAEPSLAVPTPSPSPAATPSPTASPSPTVVPIPEKPTGVTFKVVRQVPTNDGYRETHRVTWMTPRSAGIEMRVWGVTACLSEPKHPKPGAAGPCLVPHTALPASVLEPITNAKLPIHPRVARDDMSAGSRSRARPTCLGAIGLPEGPGHRGGHQEQDVLPAVALHLEPGPRNGAHTCGGRGYRG